MELRIEVESGPLLPALEQLRKSLSALEQVPEFPLECLLRLGQALADDLAVEPLCPTPNACDDRIVLRVAGHFELFAAAVGALERYVCHVAAPSRG